MMRKIKIGLIFGGRSEEHDISIISAKSIYKNLSKERYNVSSFYIDKEGFFHKVDSPFNIDRTQKFHLVKLDNLKPIDFGEIDIFFPILHGPYGEDGTIQGFFELIGKPYVGCGVLGSAIGMDKIFTKKILKFEGINVSDFIHFSKKEWQENKEKILSEIKSQLTFPVFVKPSSLGSSVGIRKVKAYKDLASAIEHAFNFSKNVLVERGISGKEIECSVLGDTDSPQASLPGRIIPYNEFYDYEDKYILGKTKFEIPVKLSEEKIKEIQELAKKTFKALSLFGMARVDFFLEDGTEKLYVNEVNTIPGFTEISMYPKLWEVSGLSFGELLDKLVELAIKR